MKREINLKNVIDGTIVEFLNEEETKEIEKSASTIFNIPDWNSEKGLAMRRKIGVEVKNLFQLIVQTITEYTEETEKIKKLKKIIKASSIISGIIGLQRLVFNTGYVRPRVRGVKEMDSFWDWIGSPMEAGYLQIGGGFWFKLAIFLFLLGLVYNIITAPKLFMNQISKMWDYVGNIFRNKNIKESISLNEYRIIETNLLI